MILCALSLPLFITRLMPKERFLSGDTGRAFKFFQSFGIPLSDLIIGWSYLNLWSFFYCGVRESLRPMVSWSGMMLGLFPDEVPIAW
jgi:hypothetical protein